MSHDFSANTPGTPRFDSTGANCTNIGGIMDYFQAITFMVDEGSILMIVVLPSYRQCTVKSL
jgi:hypothetical protein